MITKVGFKNVRVFKELQEFDINKLTVLTGTNNSGKSTIQKMLLLFSKNFNQRKDGVLDFETIDFSNDFEITGDFNCNVNYESKEKELVFSFEYNDKYHGVLKALLYYEKSEYNEKGILKKINILKDETIILNLITKKTENNQMSWEFDETQFEEKIAIYIIEIIKKFQNIINLETQLYTIDKKLQTSQNLTKDEQNTVIEYKKQGIIFNSVDAKNEINQSYDMEAMGIPYYGNPHNWQIYDTKKKCIYKLNTANDFVLKKNIKNFLNTNDFNILPSKLYHQVINEDIFVNNNLNDDLEKTFKRLKKNDIFSKEIFLEKYKEFNLNYILSLFSWIIGDSEKTDILGNDEGYISFKNILNFGKEKKHHWNSAITAFGSNNLIDNKNIIFEIIEEESINKTTINKVTNEIKESDLIHPLVKDIRDFLFEIILSPLKSFTDSLEYFVNQLSLSYYDKSIKRHYLFNDKNITNNPFLDFGIKCINLTDEKEPGQELSERGKELKYINEWIKKLGFAEELIVEPIKINTEIIGVSYFLKNKGQKIPLGNSGLGINNIILLLINIQLSNNYSKIICLEEPEANLHPAYQSLLAEILLDKETKAKFIVETHSEYFIRKLQILVADNIIKNNNSISIYYFNNPRDLDYQKNIVRTLNVKKDGFLDDEFGTGFFDESIKLMKHLLRIKKYQTN